MGIKLSNISKLLTAFYTILIFASLFLFISTVSAITIFEDGFESGNLSKWSPIGGSPSVTSGDAYQGTYKAVLDPLTWPGEWAQARFTFTPVDQCFMRAYVMFKNFPATGEETPVLGVYNWASYCYMSEIRVANVAGTIKWKLLYYHNGIHYAAISELQKPTLDTWYCVEVEGKSNTIVDAESRVYVDGNELTDVSRTGMNNNYQITCAYLWAYGPVTHWYDCVVVADTYIGPENTEAQIQVDLNPRTLNLKSKGEWITAYIELPEDYDVNNIDVSTFMLNNTIHVNLDAPSVIGDHDNDSIPDLMVKFSQSEVVDFITSMIGRPRRLSSVTLIITGELDNGTMFEGVDIIRAIYPRTRGIGGRTFIN